MVQLCCAVRVRQNGAVVLCCAGEAEWCSCVVLCVQEQRRGGLGRAAARGRRMGTCGYAAGRATATGARKCALAGRCLGQNLLQHPTGQSGRHKAVCACSPGVEGRRRSCVQQSTCPVFYMPSILRAQHSTCPVFTMPSILYAGNLHAQYPTSPYPSF